MPRLQSDREEKAAALDGPNDIRRSRNPARRPEIVIGLRVFWLALVVACAGDRGAFEHAEAVFNTGDVDSAAVLYRELIESYPTSEWRETAERQLARAQQVAGLLEAVDRLADVGQIELAAASVREIASLNPRAIDTTVAFHNLRMKEDSIADAAEVIKAEMRAAAAARKAEMLAELDAVYAQVLPEGMMEAVTRKVDDMTRPGSLVSTRARRQYRSEVREIRQVIANMVRELDTVRYPAPRLDAALLELDRLIEKLSRPGPGDG